MNSDQPHRKTLRLRDYDYSQPGDYFITLVTHEREPLFGEIANGEIILNQSGQILVDTWQSIPARYPQIELGPSVIMPNHFHAIITINDPAPIVGVIHELPLRNELPLPNEPPLPNESPPPVRAIHESPAIEPPQSDNSSGLKIRRRMLLPLVIGYLKMNSAKQINLLRDSSGVPVWQRNYYEHIINSDKEYAQIEAYIDNNPSMWLDDTEFRG